MPKTRDRRTRKANDTSARSSRTGRSYSPSRSSRTGGVPRASSRNGSVSGRGSFSGAGSSRPSSRRPLDGNALNAVPGGKFDAPSSNGVSFTTTRVGSARRDERARRLRASSRRYLIHIIVVIGVIVALLAGWAALYNSSAFTIENISVKGVEHLTQEEMAELAGVPADTTLLRVDTDAIAKRIQQDSWVEDVKVNRVFPNTLEIDVTERAIAAIVEISTGSEGSISQWAIAKDHVWLMPIPEAGSEAAKTTSSKIYEDAQEVLHIVDVPFGTRAAVGEVCTDSNVNNALDIIAGMTTELADHVVEVSASGTAETRLLLDNGVEVAFGKAEDIRDKERTILKILEENPDGISYINVRVVETPTWRGI